MIVQEPSAFVAQRISNRTDWVVRTRWAHEFLLYSFDADQSGPARPRKVGWERSV